MKLSKHAIRLQEREEIGGAMRALSGLKDMVVVNISGSEKVEPSLFCEDNLRDILSGSPAELYVEALPLGEFKKLVREKIGQVTQAAPPLADALRTRQATELGDELRIFLRNTEQLLLMLDCYGLQNPHMGLGSRAAELRATLSAIASSCSGHPDNVRCLDGLRYEILPAMKILLKVFRK